MDRPHPPLPSVKITDVLASYLAICLRLNFFVTIYISVSSTKVFYTTGTSH